MARVPAGQTLVFLASARFVWRFPEHLGLFLALLALEKGGCVKNSNIALFNMKQQQAKAP